MRRLEPILRRALRGPCELPRGSRLLVAVSGGADSTALLFGLHRLAAELGLELAAAHLHHGLRGSDADRDLAFVRRGCRALHVPLVAARWDATERMRRRGLAGEAGLRTLRREFLRRAARRTGAVAIATGHTADDQAETLLLRLARGTGLTGLAGMRARRGAWIKPLLAATRADVEADLRAAGERWRTDASNRDLRYARNRVRHRVVPALAGVLGDDRAGLARRIARVAAEADSARAAIAEAAAAAWPEIVRDDAGEIALDSTRLGSYLPALRREIWRRFWIRHAGAIGLTYRHLGALEALAAAPRGGRVELPGGWIAERDRKWVRCMRPVSVDSVARLGLRIPGATRWGGLNVAGRWASGASARRSLRAGPEGEFFAADGLEGEVEVREGRADEVFDPFGGRGTLLLGSFLSKQPVSRRDRVHPKVLADAGGILWVIGVRRARRAPITRDTRTALWVQVERHE